MKSTAKTLALGAALLCLLAGGMGLPVSAGPRPPRLRRP